MKGKGIFIILIVGFIIRLLSGILSGAADADAGDYTTLAIQISKYNDFSLLIDMTNGRQIFYLWILVMVMFMKILGPTNLTAIITVSAIGTLAVYFFYKNMMLVWNHKESILSTIIFCFFPIIISVSENPLYDTFLLLLLLISNYYYLRFILKSNKNDLYISAIYLSLISLVHPSSYLYIGIYWLFTLLFFCNRIQLKSIVIFSIMLLIYPIIQAFLWKFYYNSFYPYPKMYNDWLDLSGRGYNLDVSFLAHIKYYLIFIFSLSPLLIFALLAFIFDIDWGKYKFLFFIFLILAIGLLIRKIPLFSNVSVIIWCLLYVFIFKRKLIKENPLVFIFGFFSIFLLFLFLVSSNIVAPQIRGFVYICAFLIPLLWFYSKKILKSSKVIFYSICSFYLILMISAVVINNTKYKDLENSLMKKKYSVALRPYLTYNVQYDYLYKIVNWCRNNRIKSEQYVMSNILGRYIPSNLNMPQNHYLCAIGEDYVLKRGFISESLSKYLSWINQYHPVYIIWDVKKHNEDYNIIDKSGKRKMNFTYDEFYKSINNLYYPAYKIAPSIIIFKILRNQISNYKT